jgi:phage/plasmid-associated DNA primase
VPFEVTFTDQQQDPDLGKKLEAEGPGILAWMVQGGLDWQANGLTIPDRVKTATDGYRAQEDHIGRFLADCTTTGGAVATSQLREAYDAWCVDAGEKPWNGTAFGRELTSRGYPRGEAWRTQVPPWHRAHRRLQRGDMTMRQDSCPTKVLVGQLGQFSLLPAIRARVTGNRKTVLTVLVRHVERADVPAVLVDRIDAELDR